VCGHLISKTAMGPSLLTSFAKVTSQSAIWRVERLVAIMERSSGLLLDGLSVANCYATN
jgi:hypothetical protein